MKYQHRTTKIVVHAQQFKLDQTIHLISEHQIIDGQIKNGQYVVSFYSPEGEIVNQKIMDEDLFLEQYEPKKELLLG